ncbi:MAG: dienelactone hydrolase family protein [Candidatus Fibromonas sp.]|jgi:phospholipase/carboxylesterase|nr:dienelactone hydrolase family protein [Candidatus Fibromonas sp.]
MLDFIAVETAENPNAAIIWLHGLGADGYDFADIVPELGLPPDAAIRFIFPHAPIMPVSINEAYEMHAWYDIVTLENLERDPDIKGIEENSKLVAELVDAEIEKGINPERILLAGFSQGGVMALHTAMRYEKKLAGVVSLSSYLPTMKTTPPDGINAKIPVFIGHGNFDSVVPAALSQKVFDFLKTNGNPVERHTYDMQHSVCLEELKTLGTWIYKQLTN